MRSRRHQNRHRTLRIALATVVGLLCLLLSLRAGHADGAYVVEDAGVDDPGKCKVESWAAFANNRDFIGVVAPACVVNFGRPVEITVPIGRIRSDGVWSTDLVLEAKTPIVPFDDGSKFGVALVGGVGFNLTRGDTAAAFVTVPFSFQASEALRLDLNVGVLRNIVDDRTLFTWGAGASLSVTPQVALIAETFGFGHKVGAQVGVRYTPHEKVDFDLIYGRNIEGDRADWLTVGVNLRF
jgi:hypothetical protein